MPEIHINMTAIILAVVANFILGFLWYTPLFGKIWAKEMGFNLESGEKPAASVMIKNMAIMIVGNFLTAWVFAHNIAVWNPITWGLPASEMSPAATVMSASIFTWLGFYLPLDLNTVTWEMKSWKLFFINTSYHFLTLLIAAILITHL